jgi:hypothetical protein
MAADLRPDAVALKGAVTAVPFDPPEVDLELARQFFAANDSVVAHLGAQFVFELRDVPESFDGIVEGWQLTQKSDSDAFLCTSLEPGSIRVYNGPTADITVSFPLSQTKSKFIPIGLHASDAAHLGLVDHVSGFVIDCGKDCKMRFDGARALDLLDITVRGFYLWYADGQE